MSTNGAADDPAELAKAVLSLSNASKVLFKRMLHDERVIEQVNAGTNKVATRLDEALKTKDALLEEMQLHASDRADECLRTLEAVRDELATMRAIVDRLRAR